MDYREKIKEYFDKETEAVSRLDLNAINESMNALAEAWKRDGDIYIFGNGGSAATASHFVCDFNKGLSDALGNRKFRFHCLSDNVPIMTAIANDGSYEDVFLKQLEGVLRAGDLVIAISGSGNSKNVVRAAEYAKNMAVPVISVTGYDGGALKELADYEMHVPVDDMQVAEDVHMEFDHMMLRVMSETEKR